MSQDSVPTASVYRIGSRMTQELGLLSGQLGLTLPSSEPGAIQPHKGASDGMAITTSSKQGTLQKKTVRIDDSVVEQTSAAMSASAQDTNHHQPPNMSLAAYRWGESMDYHLSWAKGLMENFEKAQRNVIEEERRRTKIQRDVEETENNERSIERRKRRERHKKRQERHKRREQAKEIAKTLVETLKEIQQSDASRTKESTAKEEDKVAQHRQPGSSAAHAKQSSKNVSAKPSIPRHNKNDQRSSSFLGSGGSLAKDNDEARYWNRAKQKQKQVTDTRKKLRGESQNDNSEICRHCLIHHGKSHACKSPQKGLEGMMNYALQVDAPNNVVTTKRHGESHPQPSTQGSDKKERAEPKDENSQEKRCPIYLEYSPPNHGRKPRRNENTMPQLSLSHSQSLNHNYGKKSRTTGDAGRRSHSPASLAGQTAANKLRRSIEDFVPDGKKVSADQGKRDNQFTKTLAAGTLPPSELLERSRKDGQKTPPRRVDKTRDSTKSESFLRKGTGTISSGNFVSTR